MSSGIEGVLGWGLIRTWIGMNIRWDYFVNQYDTSRYVASTDARDNRHIQFVREFASVVSVLQVRLSPTFVFFSLI